MIFYLPVIEFSDLLWSVDIASIDQTAGSQRPTHQGAFRGCRVLQRVFDDII